MTENPIYIPAEDLKQFMADTFTAVGVPGPEAEICSEVLITSDLRGIESHGIGRLKMYYDRIKKGIQQPVTRFEVLREAPATAVVDGHDGMGQVIAVRAMQMAIDKARKYGMGSVAVRNSSHFGIDGYYPLMAIKEGMAGMSFTNARPSISPTFGVQPMLGTNPIAFGAPSDEECPFLFDGATSIVQRGKYEVLSRLEKPGLEGWAIDQQGKDITDANLLLKGLADDTAALLPLGGAGESLGGHKGYGLAVMVEIFSAAFQNGAFLQTLIGIDENGQTRPNRLGHFFMALNIESFTDLDSFKKTTGEILRGLRAARKAPGCERIYTAGEKEFEMEKINRQRGIPIPPGLRKEIIAIQADLRLKRYPFPF
jgi:LDH2 family malate/lactate/ureidoglycolate dehydrogenase